MPNIATSPGQKSQFPPDYRHRYTHRNGKTREQIFFSAKHRTYQTLKIAYSIPAMNLVKSQPINIPHQRETLDALPEVHRVYGTVISPPPTRPIVMTLQRETRDALPKVRWVHRFANIYYSRLSRNERYQYNSKIPPTSEVTSKELQYYCYTGVRNYDQSTDIHSRRSRNK